MSAIVMKVAGRAAGSLAWLSILYGGLLYLAVGVLGVSELTTRIGAESANIIHLVTVAKEIRAQERDSIAKTLAKIEEKSADLDTAIKVLRDFGVTQGLALQEIQPIIDTYNLAPSLAELRKKSFPMDLERAWADRMAAVMGLQLDIAKLKENLEKHRAAARSIWSSHPHIAEEAKRANLEPIDLDVAANTANTLQKLGYGALFALPAEILTLLLALSMGALGSTLHITKTVLDGSETRSLSYYLVRLFQGMVTALVVFVLLKAGQLTVSAGDNDSLNTFFVSFAAIAAGLLAEEAYRMIKKAGAGIIKTDDGEARWAFGLREAMEAGHVSPEDLAAGIGSSPTEIAAWMDESQATPKPQQTLIATWLHLPERRLFTSQPPDPSAAAEGG